MKALAILAQGLLVLGFLLVAAWLGFVAWAEAERGAWREEAGENPAPAEAGDAANGGDDLRDAHAWYRAFTGGEVILPESPEGIAAYVRDTEEFVARIESGVGAEVVRLDVPDGVLEELAECVEHALVLRAGHFATQAGGLPRALEAIDLLFTFLDRLPTDSIRRAELRADRFGRAIATLRRLALRREFPVATARPVFDRHLRMLASNDDLHAAIAGERERRVRAVVRTLEPGALDEDWRRPAWRALLREGDIVPLRYREERGALRTIDALAEAIDRPPADRSARVDALPPDPVVARAAVVLERRPGLQATARITRLGLAALQHRAEHGAWPMDPSALESIFDGALPVDPYSGQLFPFHRTDAELHFAPSRPVTGAAWTLRPAP